MVRGVAYEVSNNFTDNDVLTLVERGNPLSQRPKKMRESDAAYAIKVIIPTLPDEFVAGDRVSLNDTELASIIVYLQQMLAEDPTYRKSITAMNSLPVPEQAKELFATADATFQKMNESGKGFAKKP